MHARRAFLLYVTAFCLVATPVGAVPLLTGFGGPLGFGTDTLPPNDDGYSMPIDITPAFPGGLQYFGNTYRVFYVNNNGNISFNMGLSEYTPQAFPVASQPMIAPWWGDVDTRGGGNPMINSVWWHLEAGRIVVTWNQVGYYGAHNDKLNSFQLVLSNDPACPGPGNFDVEFRYAQCQWTTGDASGGSGGLGGTPAQAGFDAGNLRDYYAIPGSRTMSILDVCTTHNGTGIPGDWLFSICDGMIIGGCPGGGAACTVPGQIGVCAQGINQCSGMGSTTCAQIHHPTMEICDGLDNDCDGVLDDLPPQPCYEGPTGTDGLGLCHGGNRFCRSAMFGACEGQVLPAPEQCDRLDNDCDGRADDLPPRACYSGPPATAGVGVCHAGTQLCSDGSWSECVGEALPGREVCDGLDNDCNGLVDDGLPGCIPEPMPDVIDDAADVSSDLGGDVSEDHAGSDTFCSPGDPRCNPAVRFGGRAGPGCDCRVSHLPASPRMFVGVIAVALAMLCSRRRRRS